MSRSGKSEYEDLLKRIVEADGYDPDLDYAIAHTLAALPEGADTPAYTASVDRCLDLLHRLLPGWRWHIGFGASGVMPYTAIKSDGQRFEGTAPTVPLAMLKVILRAKLSLNTGSG